MIQIVQDIVLVKQIILLNLSISIKVFLKLQTIMYFLEISKPVVICWGTYLRETAREVLFSIERLALCEQNFGQQPEVVALCHKRNVCLYLCWMT